MHCRIGLIALVLFLALPCFAQELPPPALMVTEGDRSRPLEVSRVEADVRIVGHLAQTRMTLTFYNPQQRRLAGDLYFPLPEGATVSGYALDVQGKMVDGVVVEKDKARQAFEKEVRKGIDPGLVEWVKGNNFKTRVFPVPPQGTRTVTVRYLAPLQFDETGPVYLLPLNFSEPVGHFHLRVEVVKAPVKPQVKKGGLANFAFESWRDSFVAETTLEKKTLTQNLVIAIPDIRPEAVQLEEGPDGKTWFCLSDAPPEVAAAQHVPRLSRVTILWDASGSRGRVKHDKELALLRKYFARDPQKALAVDLVLFRHQAEAPRRFTVANGDASALLEALRTVDYDGGTQMHAVTPPRDAPVPDFYLLFSDGLSNFGQERPGAFPAPVFALTADSTAFHGLLRYIATSSGGAYYNLARVPEEVVLDGIGLTPFSFLRARVESGRVSGLYPDKPRPVAGRLLLAGILESDEAVVTLEYGVGNAVLGRKKYTLSRADAGKGTVLRTFWAQQRIDDLATFPEENADLLLQVGQEFGLVTPGTSLMVLETLEQYVEHRIEPPESLPEMRAAWREQVEEFHRRRAAQEEDKIQTVLAMWQQRVDWWNRTFEYPPDFRYREAEEKKDGVLSGSGAGAAAPDDRPAATEVMEEAADEAERDRRVARPSPKKKAKNGNGGDEPPPPPPEIVIKEWDPQTPYLAALKKAAPKKRFAVYMKQRREHGTSPAFFLDCANFFFRNDAPEIGLQVLTNITELELDNAALLRVAAHRLAQQEYLAASRDLFEKVLKMRPEEPQSYRDLALVLDREGAFERAATLLYHVVLHDWDRFAEIEVIALMELNRVLARAKRVGKGLSLVDPRLVKLLDVDVRIVLTWDTDMTDMDLWVTEPSGEKAMYSHNRTTIGGLVSRDFTQGYGPEEYLVKKAMPGKYKIEANYYGSGAPTLTGAVTVQAEVFTNFGRENEQRRTLTLRLSQAKDVYEVGTIKMSNE